MEGEKEIDLKTLFNIIKKRIWFIIIITVLMASVSVIYNVVLHTETYESQVGILIGRETADKVTDQEVVMYQTIYNTYNKIAASSEVAQIAADKLGNGTTAADILSRTKVTENAGTLILNISVKSESAEKAYKETEAYGEAFIERAKQLKLSQGDIKVVEKAQQASSSSASNVKQNAVKAAFLGLLMSILISFFLEYIK